MQDFFPSIVQYFVSIWAILVLFPLTILSLALIETRRGSLGKRLSFLGDVSYSSYLIHFPLQLTVVIVTSQLGINRDLFYSPFFLLIFFFLLLSLSLASHRYFEIPLQQLVRRHFA
jgi:peptidoglycan/LPS O-acetylase OafA/YrhL